MNNTELIRDCREALESCEEPSSDEWVDMVQALCDCLEQSDKGNVLTDEMAQWTDATFGLQEVNAKLLHLKKEVEELLAAPTDRLEYADAFILLVTAAKTVGMNYSDLLDAVREKFEICKKRNWGSPDKDGVVHHIEEINTEVVNQ